VKSAGPAGSWCFQYQCLKGEIKQNNGKLRRASSWTSALSPRPPRWVYWLVRPHKVSNKVSNNVRFVRPKLPPKTPDGFSLDANSIRGRNN